MKKAQLFLLHFAGGNAYSYQFLISYLRNFEVIPLELPGRGRRINETLLTDFDQAAEDYCHQVQSQLTGVPFMIYGHSMGAVLALRLVKLLKNIDKNPVCIVVTGNAGPGVRHTNNMHLLEQEEFISELRNLGGIPEEVLKNEELLHFFLPILRFDFQVCENNTLSANDMIDIPICAVMGSEEKEIEKISNWGRFTRSNFQFKILPGGHFFIHHHPRKIASIIKDSYDNIMAQQHQLD